MDDNKQNKKGVTAQVLFAANPMAKISEGLFGWMRSTRRPLENMAKKLDNGGVLVSTWNAQFQLKNLPESKRIDWHDVVDTVVGLSRALDGYGIKRAYAVSSRAERRIVDITLGDFLKQIQKLSGIKYANWGKEEDKFVHALARIGEFLAMSGSPWELQLEIQEIVDKNEPVKEITMKVKESTPPQ